jgi:hypothetical protein
VDSIISRRRRNHACRRLYVVAICRLDIDLRYCGKRLGNFYLNCCKRLAIRSIDDNAVEKVLIVAFAGIGGVVSGVTEIMAQIGQPGEWLYTVLIGGAFWLIGMFIWMFAFAGLLRRKA